MCRGTDRTPGCRGEGQAKLKCMEEHRWFDKDTQGPTETAKTQWRRLPRNSAGQNGDMNQRGGMNHREVKG